MHLRWIPHGYELLRLTPARSRAKASRSAKHGKQFACSCSARMFPEHSHPLGQYPILEPTKKAESHEGFSFLWWSWRVLPPRPIGNKFDDYRLIPFRVSWSYA